MPISGMAMVNPATVSACSLHVALPFTTRPRQKVSDSIAEDGVIAKHSERLGSLQMEL